MNRSKIMDRGLGQPTPREQLLDRLYATAHLADAGAFEQLQDLWAPEGVMEVHFGDQLVARHESSQALMAWMRDVRDGSPVERRHLVLNPRIESTGEGKAHTECYLVVVGTDAESSRVTASGTYVDDWVLGRDDVWRIVCRTARFDGVPLAGRVQGITAQ